MIKVTCGECKQINDVDKEEGYLEINLNDNMLYFKCFKCKKTTKVPLTQVIKPYANIRRM